mgnify:FL=1
MVRKGKYTRVTPARQARRQVRRRWQWWARLSKKKKIAVIVIPIAVLLLIIPLATYAYFARDISNQDRLMNRNNTGVVMLDKNDKVFYSIGRAQKRDLVPLDQISDTTKKALLASEDKNFYQHGGFSPVSILKAAYGNFAARDSTAYGGSTLTQQLAKNTLLSNDQSFLRKYQELAVSVAIERQYSKDQILDMYLNSVYFGENAFGIEDAAKTYFNKSPKDLTLPESAMLVGVLPAPSAYSPISGDPKLAKERQTTVLSRMVTNKFITSEEKASALKQKLDFSKAEDTNTSDAPQFAEMVLKQLYDKYGEEKVMRSGYRVNTTLDLTRQKQLQANIDSQIAYIQSRGGSNASAVAIDPSSGEVLALVGSADYSNKDFGKVNMVTTPRQPGSSFKPIYYSQALADGIITPATILDDSPKDFGGYKPLDADKQFRGDVTVRSAINQSLNIPSVEVMQKIGVKKAVEAANAMGLDTIDENKDYGLALALGTAEAPLLDMTNAYAAFANQGKQYQPILIKQINDKYDKTISKTNETSRSVLSEQGAYLISDILADNQAKAPIFGSSLTVPNHTVAVKTGTTDDNRDAWTIGYSPKLAVGVWVGNNDNTIMQSGGSDMAGPIWKNTMIQALGDSPDVSFTKPSGIVDRAVCSGTGALSSSSGNGTYNEKFLASALPTKYCSAQPEPKPQKTEPEKPAEKPVEIKCPEGQTGSPPNCQQEEPESCPEGQTGSPPNCQQEEPESCPEGQTGSPPDCQIEEGDEDPIDSSQNRPGNSNGLGRVRNALGA